MIVLMSDQSFFELSNKWFVAASNKPILQHITSEFYNENEIFCNEQLLQRVTSDILQRATSATSNEWFFCNE